MWRQVTPASLAIETYEPILSGERQNLRDDLFGLLEGVRLGLRPLAGVPFPIEVRARGTEAPLRS